METSKSEIRMSPDLIKMAETISNFEYQMTKTLPRSSGVAQYLSGSSKISFVLNLGFGTFVFVSNFEFTKNKLSKKICHFTSLSMKMTQSWGIGK